MAIKDFGVGHKIGGARKDLWSARGLQVDDLLEMNDAERQKHITKDNVWKKPDYVSLIAEGIPSRVVYFMKTIRDALPVKPVIRKSDIEDEVVREKQEGYISFIRNLKAATLQLRTEDDVFNFYASNIEPYIQRVPGHYYVEVSPEAYDCINNKLLRAARVTNFRKIDRDIQKKQFGYTKEDKEKAAKQKLLQRFKSFQMDENTAKFETDYRGNLYLKVATTQGISYYYPTGEDANPKSYEPGTFCVVKDGKICAKNLGSQEEASTYIQNEVESLWNKSKTSEQATKTSKKRKTIFVPKQLQHIQRQGDTYRYGNVSDVSYNKPFLFNWVEFGNWLSDKDGQASLNFSYDALLDLGKALSIDPSDLSFGSRLSLAFGARGKGSALAHYEPAREVINLTKMKGAGSLAHEWAHALDDICGKKLGFNGFMTDYANSNVCPKSLSSLLDSMVWKTVSTEETLQQQKQVVEKRTKQLQTLINHQFPIIKLNEKQQQKKDELVQAIIDQAPKCDASFYSYVINGNGNQEIDALSSFRKEVIGRVISKEERVEIARYQNLLRLDIEKVGKEQRVHTDFYKNSEKFDQLHSKTDHGYWRSTKEMFARAFACYVKDKIEGRSDYLCGHAEMATTYQTNPKTNELEAIHAYPIDEERMVINKGFDTLLRELKEKELLHAFDYQEAAFIKNRKPSLMDQMQKVSTSYDAEIIEDRNGQLEFEL